MSPHPNPPFGPNRPRLGIFSTHCGGRQTMALAPVTAKPAIARPLENRRTVARVDHLKKVPSFLQQMLPRQERPGLRQPA